MSLHLTKQEVVDWVRRSLTKGGRARTKAQKMAIRSERKRNEETNKDLVRLRDNSRCRIPLCGCWKQRLPLEVSHLRHKGMGGDPSGDRSETRGMVLICRWRHQHAPISRHRGTMRAAFLSEDGFDGRIGWELDLLELSKQAGKAPARLQVALNAAWLNETPAKDGFALVATEEAPGGKRWAPMEWWQQSLLEWLGRMTLLLCLLAWAQTCSAQEAPMPGYLRAATIAAGAAAGADWATTYHSLTHYRTFETNPLLRPFQEHPVDMVIVGSVIDVGTVYAWNRFVGRRHQKIATVGLWAMAGFRGYLAARNVRIEQWATPR